MESGDTLRIPVDRGLAAARAMLDRRGVEGPEERFVIEDPTIQLLWSFRRGPVCVAAVRTVDKATANALTAAYADVADGAEQLVVVHDTKCTSDGAKELEQHTVFSVSELHFNPFRFAFFNDAGLVRAADVTPALLKAIGGDPSKRSGMNVTDPLAKYLDAAEGDLVWTNDSWGTLEPTVSYYSVRLTDSS